jgi:hypothetical protein
MTPFGNGFRGAVLGNRFGKHLVVREESRASDWYCRLPIFMLFSLWGVRSSARLGLALSSISYFASGSDTLFNDGLRCHVAAWD